MPRNFEGVRSSYYGVGRRQIHLGDKIGLDIGWTLCLIIGAVANGWLFKVSCLPTLESLWNHLGWDSPRLLANPAGVAAVTKGILAVR